MSRAGTSIAMRDAARVRVLELLREYGWNATAFQVLEPEFDYWFYDEGCVAYVDTGRAWVVAGSPFARPELLGVVAEKFARVARAHRRRVAFFAVEHRFLRVADVESMRVGEQPWWDPRQWETRHRGHRSLREQLRRARAKRVRISRVSSDVVCDTASRERRGIEQLIARWLRSRSMPAMEFLVALHPFGFAEERRYYVAEQDGEIVGVLVAVPVYVRNGWFFEDILRAPDAPNGTAESLIDFAMRDVAAAGAEFVTLGLVPLAGDARWLRTARRAMRSFYNFDGLRSFKEKLRPDGWDLILLAWTADRTAPGAIYDVLAAFARGSVPRFAVLAVLRAPSVVLGTLAGLLVPWTLLLASVESERWFPSKRTQRAWVAFDVVVAAAFARLAWRWDRRLALGTAAATTADVALTAVQAARYNVPRRRGWRDLAVITVSIAAPAIATAILVGGLRTRSK